MKQSDRVGALNLKTHFQQVARLVWQDVALGNIVNDKR